MRFHAAVLEDLLLLLITKFNSTFKKINGIRISSDLIICTSNGSYFVLNIYKDSGTVQRNLGGVTLKNIKE